MALSYQQLWCHICLQLLLSICYTNAQDSMLQCLNDCTASPALLGRDFTISDCCGVDGRNGGGFLLEGTDMCINCTNFRTISGRVRLSINPEVPVFGDNITIMCQIETDELLRASGEIFLQLANNSVISNEINAATTNLAFEISSFSQTDVGTYYCNASVTSPEFPGAVLRIFQGTNLVEITAFTSDPTTLETSITASSTISALTTTSKPTTDILTTILTTVSSSTPNITFDTTMATSTASSTPPGVSFDTTAETSTAQTTSLASTLTPPSPPTPTPTSITMPPDNIRKLTIFVKVDFQVLKTFRLICHASEAVLDLQWLNFNGSPIEENSYIKVGHMMKSKEKSNITLHVISSAVSINGYICSSKELFTSSKVFINVNECAEKMDNCPLHTNCIDLKQGFKCVCKPGFVMHNGVCKDINECIGKNECHPYAVCHNTPGGYKCRCSMNYIGNGIKCNTKRTSKGKTTSRTRKSRKSKSRKSKSNTKSSSMNTASKSESATKPRIRSFKLKRHNT